MSGRNNEDESGSSSIRDFLIEAGFLRKYAQEFTTKLLAADRRCSVHKLSSKFDDGDLDVFLMSPAVGMDKTEASMVSKRLTRVNLFLFEIVSFLPSSRNFSGT
jgi:hypothetical protein